jgi:hypothetical protein
MTTSFLKYKCTPINVNDIKIGNQYRIIGRIIHQGSIFTVEKIENNELFLKGYIKPYDLDKISLYNL